MLNEALKTKVDSAINKFQVIDLWNKSNVILIQIGNQTVSYQNRYNRDYLKSYELESTELSQIMSDYENVLVIYENGAHSLENWQ